MSFLRVQANPITNYIKSVQPFKHKSVRVHIHQRYATIDRETDILTNAYHSVSVRLN